MLLTWIRNPLTFIILLLIHLLFMFVPANHLRGAFLVAEAHLETTLLLLLILPGCRQVPRDLRDGSCPHALRGGTEDQRRGMSDIPYHFASSFCFLFSTGILLEALLVSGRIGNCTGTRLLYTVPF